MTKHETIRKLLSDYADVCSSITNDPYNISKLTDFICNKSADGLRSDLIRLVILSNGGKLASKFPSIEELLVGDIKEMMNTVVDILLEHNPKSFKSYIEYFSGLGLEIIGIVDDGDTVSYAVMNVFSPTTNSKVVTTFKIILENDEWKVSTI